MTQDTLTEVRSFLSLISDEVAPDEIALISALDRLMMTYQQTPHSYPSENDLEPPKLDGGALYQKMAKRFPALGMYPVADPLVDIDEAIMMGDAIDDLADIYRDLHEVIWRSEHLGDDDALWYFRLMFSHWGAHVRGLTFYLHARQF